jgi:AcrR family transcriptional regulator
MDARQNRQRILAAAHARFATDGPVAEMDAIARDAGVAVGTLYHHFGTKEGLLAAVVSEGLSQVVAEVHSLLDEADPWTGVERLLYTFAERHQRDRAFKELIGAQPALAATAAAAKRELALTMQKVLARAQAAGQLRSDIVAGDIPLLLAGLSERELAPADRQRYLEVVLDGLRVR